MPRNSNGLYTLPLNPVADGDIIEASWANSTMSDIANQLNNIITRDGLLGPTEPFLLANGTALLPSLSFNTQHNLGFYRDGVNSMGVTAGGVPVMKFSDEAVSAYKTLTFPDGTVTAPGMRLTSELGVGFFKFASGQVGIGLGIGGAEAVHWTQEGTFTPRVDTTLLNVQNINCTVSASVKALNVDGKAYSGVPTGTVLDHASATVPAGYLACDGAAVSRTTYAALFAVIGAVWGAGDGSTTFNVPDLRRYTTIGMGGTKQWGPNITIGSRGGEEQSAISINELPSHAHGVSDPQHWHNIFDPGHAHSVYDPGHAHLYNMKATVGGSAAGGDPQNLSLSSYATDTRATGVTVSSGYAGINGTGWGSTGISIAATGSGWGFSNMQLSAVVNKIIKT